MIRFLFATLAWRDSGRKAEVGSAEKSERIVNPMLGHRRQGINGQRGKLKAG
jgi:hypothetical protein